MDQWSDKKFSYSIAQSVNTTLDLPRKKKRWTKCVKCWVLCHHTWSYVMLVTRVLGWQVKDLGAAGCISNYSWVKVFVTQGSTVIPFSGNLWNYACFFISLFLWLELFQEVQRHLSSIIIILSGISSGIVIQQDLFIFIANLIAPNQWPSYMKN